MGTSRCDGVPAARLERPTSVSRMATLNPSPPAAARYHGDEAVAPGMLDFAVNVRHARPPEWLMRRLAARLPDLARYPSAEDVHRARDAGAERHGRTREEGLRLAGAAEGFALLANRRPVRAAVVAPRFHNLPRAVLQRGIQERPVVPAPPFGLEGV